MKAKTGSTSTAARFIAPVFGTLMLAATSSNAASITFLDQSNVLSDGVPYLQVTVADGPEGAINFTVQMLDALTAIACDKLGIQKFAFNLLPDSYVEAGNITNLPEGWRARNQTRMSEYGFFDIAIKGKGYNKVTTLTFSIDGIDGDTPEDYTVLSTGHAAGGHQFFAAHVAGFMIASDWCKGYGQCSSGFFAGSEPVPLPGAAWLFATGAAAVVARARKRKV